MFRLNLSNDRKWQINELLTTSTVGNFTAFNSKCNGYSSFGNVSAAASVGNERAGAGVDFVETNLKTD